MGAAPISIRQREGRPGRETWPTITDAEWAANVARG